MNSMAKTKWLLPILLIGMAVVTIQWPTDAPDQVLADGPPTADELQNIGALADLPPVDTLVTGPVAQDDSTTDQATQIDDDTHGTY